jgi:hypothetical protein
MNKVIKALVGIFTDEAGTISSKKLIGIAAWIVILCTYYRCSMRGIELPSDTTMILALASSLIGFNTFKEICSLFSTKGGKR